MLRKSWILAGALALGMAGAAPAATFGTVVQTGGESSDIALDEARGVLYIADFTANRVEIMSLATNRILTWINVPAHPASLSVSPDGHWLAVVGFGNNAAPASASNSFTLIDLTSGNQQTTFNLTSPPLGVAFGADNNAFIVTTLEYQLFNPVSKSFTKLDTVAGVTAKTIPVPAGSFPPDITNASIAASQDGKIIFGMGSSTGTITFYYNVLTQKVSPGGIVLSSGTLGPRVVSVNHDGSSQMAGWVMLNAAGVNNFFPHEANTFSVGTTAFDDARGLVYAHIPAIAGESPTLQILANDNFTVLQRLKLPENTKGKSVLRSNGSFLYSVSDSGVLVMPVGNLASVPRLAATVPDILFRGNFCDRNAIVQTLTIKDLGDRNTPFTITSPTPGITISPATGITPATLTISVDPTAFGASKGTTAVNLTISSATAVNVIAPVRVLVNTADPSQRGTLLNVPGELVDLIADPVRNRYYVVRQDNNTVLVFDGSNNSQIATLRTNNVPTTLAITRDNQYLLIGHNNSQALAVYDLNNFFRQPDISSDAGNGHVVRSLAVASNIILATAEDFQGDWHVLSFDASLQAAVQLPTIGVWENKIAANSVAVASADGLKVMILSPDGSIFLYDAGAGTFTISRSDVGAISGANAAADFSFVAGNNLLNDSGVPSVAMDSSGGLTSGFSFGNFGAVRTGAASASSAGYIERVDPATGAVFAVTPTVEAPLLATPFLDFGTTPLTRTLAPLSNQTGFVSLGVSGLTIFPSNFEQSVVTPVISQVVSAADQRSVPASGGLITIYGTDLSRANLAKVEYPLNTVLGNTCVTANGQPIPLFYVSPGVINAQMPYQAVGSTAMVVRMTDGVSAAFTVPVSPTAPAIFLTGQAGPSTNLPLILREFNGLLVTPSNPVHRGDTLIIYLTGLGATSPAAVNGAAAPANPLDDVINPPAVILSGQDLSVSDASLYPGQAGVYQLRVTVPTNAFLGISMPLTVTQNGVSQTTNVRVVQ